MPVGGKPRTNNNLNSRRQPPRTNNNLNSIRQQKRGISKKVNKDQTTTPPQDQVPTRKRTTNKLAEAYKREYETKAAKQIQSVARGRQVRKCMRITDQKICNITRPCSFDNERCKVDYDKWSTTDGDPNKPQTGRTSVDMDKDNSAASILQAALSNKYDTLIQKQDMQRADGDANKPQTEMTSVDMDYDVDSAEEANMQNTSGIKGQRDDTSTTTSTPKTETKKAITSTGETGATITGEPLKGAPTGAPTGASTPKTETKKATSAARVAEKMSSKATASGPTTATSGPTTLSTEREVAKNSTTVENNTNENQGNNTTNTSSVSTPSTMTSFLPGLYPGLNLGQFLPRRIGRSTKGSRSKTRPGRLDYTTKRGDRDYHRDGHDVRRKRRPYSRRRSRGRSVARKSRRRGRSAARKSRRRGRSRKSSRRTRRSRRR
jgi:hypothetical protein